jgi:hypothetical protein
MSLLLYTLNILFKTFSIFSSILSSRVKISFVYSKMDNSLRFFRYVLQLPGMASYFTDSKVTPSRVFQFKCCTLPLYEKHLSEVVLGNDNFDLDASNLPPRKLLPPVWDENDIKVIKDLIKNPSVHYIIFPCLWEEYFPISCKKHNTKTTNSHMVLFAINKYKTTVEIWDDQLAKTQNILDYDDNEDAPLEFLKPILKTFGIKVEYIGIPMLPAEKYTYLQNVLQEHQSGKSFHSMYLSFLANYLRKRTEEMTKLQTEVKRNRLTGTKATKFFKEETNTMKEVCSTVLPRMKTRINKYIICYDQLRRHNELFPELKSNIDTYHNPNFPIPEVCPQYEYRDVGTNECQPLPTIVSIPEGKFENERARSENIIYYYHYVCLYLLQKYPNMTTIVPHDKKYAMAENFALMFRYDPDKKSRIRFNLTTPPGWDRFMKRAMANDNVRFIAVMVSIKGRLGRNHANVLIIDKSNNTVEHYEPNTGALEEGRWGNGQELAETLQKYFEKENKFTSGKYKYISAEQACPRGLHRYEWHERSKNIFDTGGNCALWSIFMMDLRLGNPDIPSKILTQYAAQEIARTGSFKHFIDAYADYVVRTGKQTRKQILKEKNHKSVKS